MTPLLLIGALLFAGGVFIGDAIGFRRCRWFIERGIREGRFNLTTARAHRRRRERLLRHGGVPSL